MMDYDMLVEIGGALLALAVLWLVSAGIFWFMRWKLRTLEQRIIANRVDEWVKRRGLNKEEWESLRKLKERAEKEGKLHG